MRTPRACTDQPRKPVRGLGGGREKVWELGRSIDGTWARPLSSLDLGVPDCKMRVSTTINGFIDAWEWLRSALEVCGVCEVGREGLVMRGPQMILPPTAPPTRAACLLFTSQIST